MSSSVTMDMLTAALKAFEKGRTTSAPEGWTSWDAWASALRETFQKVDARLLQRRDFDYVAFMQKYAGLSFKAHEQAERRAVIDFLRDERKAPHPFAWYLNVKNRPQAAGMSPAVQLNLMTKVRPVEFPGYAPQIREAFVFLGLVNGPLPRLSIKAYEAEKVLQDAVIARMFQLGVGQVAGDRDAYADYLTVAEFAAWLALAESRTQTKNLAAAAQPPLPKFLKGGVSALVFR